MLQAIGDELIARCDELGTLLSREEGKPFAEGRGAYRGVTHLSAEDLSSGMTTAVEARCWAFPDLDGAVRARFVRVPGRSSAQLRRTVRKDRSEGPFVRAVFRDGFGGRSD